MKQQHRYYLMPGVTVTCSPDIDAKTVEMLKDLVKHAKKKLKLGIDRKYIEALNQKQVYFHAKNSREIIGRLEVYAGYFYLYLGNFGGNEWCYRMDYRKPANREDIVIMREATVQDLKLVKIRNILYAERKEPPMFSGFTYCKRCASMRKFQDNICTICKRER